jgi:amidase
MAATIAGLTLGMQLLEPGFTPSSSSARVVGRVRTSGDPMIEAAIDNALRAAEFEVVAIDWDVLEPGVQAFAPIYFAEMWNVDHALVESSPDLVGPDIAQTVATADLFRGAVDDAREALVLWRAQLLALFDRVELLALPTLPILPPRIDHVDEATLLPTIIELTQHVALFNAAGTPCTAQPVPLDGQHLPASLQLVGPHHSEELLLTTAQRVESAIVS